jgi:hypothetical protein
MGRKTKREKHFVKRISDFGIVNYLLKRVKIEIGSESYGNAFEHFIYQEIVAHAHYSGIQYPLYYWRTTGKIIN